MPAVVSDFAWPLEQSCRVDEEPFWGAGLEPAPRSPLDFLFQRPAEPSSCPVPQDTEAIINDLFGGMYDHRPQGLPVDISAVDDSDVTGWLSAAVRAGEVTGFRDVEELVQMVLAEAEGRPVGTLALSDHGSPGSQQFGNERAAVWHKTGILTNPAARAALKRLAGAFSPAGRIDLHGCEVADGVRGQALLKEIARLTGVPVRGGKVAQRPLLPGYEGSVVTCYPPPLPVVAGKPDFAELSLDEREYVASRQECTVDSHPIMDRIWGWNPFD